MGIVFFVLNRELRDVRQRLDNLSHDVKRKESQVKELQSRLDSGEGCKLKYLLQSLDKFLWFLW